MLDVGCAMGFLLDLARDQGWTVEGVELSEYACLHAVEELHLPVLHGTLHDAEFDGGKFDAVTLFDVIEHFPNPRKEIREVARVLRPGGIFAVTTPDVGSLVARLLGRNWAEIRRVREHTYFFSRKTLRKMLEAEGFEVLRIERAGRYFPVWAFVERGKRLSKMVFGFVEKISVFLGLQEKMIYVDRRYKMTIYARRRAGAAETPASPQ